MKLLLVYAIGIVSRLFKMARQSIKSMGELQGKIEAKYGNLSKFSESKGIPYSLVWRTFNGERAHAKTLGFIAEEFDIDYAELLKLAERAKK